MKTLPSRRTTYAGGNRREGHNKPENHFMTMFIEYLKGLGERIKRLDISNIPCKTVKFIVSFRRHRPTKQENALSKIHTIPVFKPNEVLS